MIYLWVKYLHIIAAVLLFGFGFGSYLYFIAANRTKDPRIISAVGRMVVFFDAWITTPAGIIQILSGTWLALYAGFPMASGWLLQAISIISLVGLLWLPVLCLQKRIQSMAQRSVETGVVLGDVYEQLYRWWLWIGILGFSGMLGVVFLMVTKKAIL